MQHRAHVGIAAKHRVSLQLFKNARPQGMTYHGGRLLTQVKVKPIFWGPQWLTAGHQPVLPEAIVWAIRSILFSPYLSGLGQYGIGGGRIESLALASFDAGPPNAFNKADIERMLKGLLDDRIIAHPGTERQLLACVFTPPGIHSDDANANGYHSFMDYQGSFLPYAWLSNDSTLDFISSIFSHELAEACTNPTDQGFFDDAGACGQTGHCEISDYCYGLQRGRGTEPHGGVWVQAYWSEQDQRCIVPQERFVSGRTVATPSLIQGRFLSPGNFELVAPLQSGGIGHYSRVNSDASLPWVGPAVFATELGHIEGLSMIQSNFTTGGFVGDLELVVLAQGSLLHYSREDVPPYRWHGPFPIPTGANLRGNPVLIQGRFLARGNFELIVPLATGGIAHYSRVNDDPRLPWFGPTVFATELGQVDAVTMIQSNFSSGGKIGNLEVVARCGGNLFFYFREDLPPYRWHGPVALPTSGTHSGVTLASGCPSLIQNRNQIHGNFELVTPLLNGGMAHYSRASSQPGMPWSGPSVFGLIAGQVEAVSLIQSTFKLESFGVGNLELVAQAGGRLFHYWHDNPANPVLEGFPWNWFGPWELTR